MRSLLPFSLLFLGFAACADNPPPPAPPPRASPPAPPPPATIAPAADAPPPPVALTADTPETTSSGATFVAPAGWTLHQHGHRALLRGPEHDLRIAIVDSTATSADDAVAAAWAAMRVD